MTATRNGKVRDRRRQVTAMREKGMKPREIADELDMTAEAVYRDLDTVKSERHRMTNRQVASKRINEARGCIEEARELLSKDGINVVEARMLTAAAETLACVAHAGVMVARFRVATRGKELEEGT